MKKLLLSLLMSGMVIGSVYGATGGPIIVTNSSEWAPVAKKLVDIGFGRPVRGELRSEARPNTFVTVHANGKKYEIRIDNAEEYSELFSASDSEEKVETLSDFIAYIFKEYEFSDKEVSDDFYRHTVSVESILNVRGLPELAISAKISELS